MRRWTAASLLVVAALYARATGQWAVALPVAALVVAALALGERLALSPGVTQVATALALGAGGALGWVLVPAQGQPLRPPWPSLALAGLLAGALTLCRAGSRQSSARALLPGLLALTACGEAPLGRLYGAVALIHLAFALLALREGDHPEGAPPPLLARRGAPIAALLGGVAAAVTAGLVLGLPPLSRWTEARILRSLGEGAEVGFSDRMWHDSLDGVLQSDEVVMRLDGPHADYLRGAVYDHCELGIWGQDEPERPAPARPGGAAAGGPRVHATLVSGLRDRYFLPLGARAVDAGGEPLAVDRFGVVFAASSPAQAISFEAGPGEGPPSFPVAGPSDDDLRLPPAQARTLRRIAAEWTAGAATPEDKVDAIAERLRTRFTYSLHFDHGRRSDALLHFLLHDHEGHCVFFASAMTLLARAAGVPARVAAGYRVVEENPLGGYWIVRERNAHAWSEVFLPGRGFVTVDATPSGGGPESSPHRMGFLGALWDLAGVTLARAFARLTLLHAIEAFLAVAAVGLLVRWLRRRKGPKEQRTRRLSMGKPPPDLARLFAALARRGLVRAESEPLERFAGRLKGPDLGPAAEVLRRWAAFRYGEEGDGEALARDLASCAARLGSRDRHLT